MFLMKGHSELAVRLASGPLVLSTATTISIIHRNYTTLYGADRRPIGSIRWKGRAWSFKERQRAQI